MITHNLGVVAGFADRVMVMYSGRIVEENLADDLFARAESHPYTRGRHCWKRCQAQGGPDVAERLAVGPRLAAVVPLDRARRLPFQPALQPSVMERLPGRRRPD